MSSLGDDPITPQAFELWQDVRNADCARCELHKYARNICIVGNGAVPSRAMIVGESPDEQDDRTGRIGHGEGMDVLAAILNGMGVEHDQVYLTTALKCIDPKTLKKKTFEEARRSCAPYLEQEILRVRPRAILAMGRSAYHYFAHTEAITKNRGQLRTYIAGADTDDPFEVQVVPTFNPDAVCINPKLTNVFESDVKKWWRLVQGEETSIEVDIIEVHSLDDLVDAVKDLSRDMSRICTWDAETRGFVSHRDDYSRLWCIAATVGDRTVRGIKTYLIPLEHPDAPWYGDKEQTYEAIKMVCDLILRRPKTNGHNQRFDMRWLRATARRWNIDDSVAKINS